MEIPHRWALVTGGSRAIGRAVAIRFAAEGVSVAINHARDAAIASHTLGALAEINERQRHGKRQHSAIGADMGDASAVTGLIGETLRRLGTFDIFDQKRRHPAPAPANSFEEAARERILAVNLVGAAGCAKATIRHFLSHQGGAIINTISVHEWVPNGYLACSITKGGLVILPAP
jgi:glucose 1-dehydrogenase